MRRILVAAAMLLCIGVSAFAQTSSISGTVADPTNALIPGVTVTATNTGTGVTTTSLTNDSGAYNFVTLPPGPYKLTATLGGFQTASVTNITLGSAETQRFNITMKLGNAQGTTVDVAVDASQIIAQSSSSVGDVLTADKIRNLPLVGNNVIDLLNILPGLRLSPLGAASNTIGGLNMDSINVTRDGLNTNDGRYSSTTYGYGVFSSTTINPDLVGEIKLILSPVDAELGRGNSQIQISTRSGTNKYTGSAVWNIQNTALNSNTWGNNNDTVNGVWTPTKPDWRNTNQITASYGGPIVKNKTFFFVLYDQTINNTRETQTVNVMTDTARLGIYRYFAGYNPGAYQSTPTTLPTTSTNPNWPAVNDVGFPQAPPFNLDGVTPYNLGGLQCFSVFGPKLLDGTTIVPGPAAANDPYCPGGTWATNGANPWDDKRPGYDATGYITRVLNVMPRANRFQGGDGLNQAQFRWLRTRQGSNSNAAIVGADAYSNRKQINVKLDQNFNAKNKVSGGITYQLDDSADNVSQWPGGLNGTISRRPIVVTVNGTSTLSPSLLNEARFGLNRNKTASVPAWLNVNSAVADEAQTWLLDGGVNSVNGKIYPVVLNPTAGNYGFSGNGYLATTTASQIGNTTPLYNYADTLSWTTGRHALKFGIELRYPRTNGYNTQPYPSVTMGNNASATNTASPFGSLSNFATQLPTFRQNARNNAASMSYFLSGSVASASQPYWIENAENVKNAVWDDTTTKDNRLREQVKTEWDAFVKDDFKISKGVTLNLGLRYEYYGSPYLRSGLTSAAQGLGNGLFGANRGAGGALFDNYLSPGNLYLSNYGSSGLAGGLGVAAGANPLACVNGTTQSALLPTSNCDPSLQTTIEFIGPNSPNPSKVAIPVDKNNFGPAVGFAWQVPWFGEGKTSVRGGYQVTFGSGGGDGIAIDTLLGSAPGNALTAATLASDAQFACIVNGTLCPNGSLAPARALNIGDIPLLVPVRPIRAPGATVPIFARSVGYTAYDPNFRTPYTQNLTLSITRNVSKMVTLDVRYIGTLARKQTGSLNLNDSTVYYNKELFDALLVARAGGESPLLDQMLAGLNLNVGVVAPNGLTYGQVGTTVGGVLQTGASHLRRSTVTAGGGQPTLQTALANGDFEYVTNLLVTLAPASGLQPLPIDPATGIAVAGVQLRTLRNGCDRIANGLYNPALPASATNIPTHCFPENYLTSNNQFSGATYQANLGHSNYHALQVGATVRPLQGVTVQSTYSWAKSMQLPGSGYTDPLNRDLDYARGREGPHSIRMNGTVELPMGPNKLLFGNSSGWVARLVERWQTSFIFNAATGSPADITGAGNTRYGNARMVVASDLWEIPHGQVEWGRLNNTQGSFYGDPSPYVSTRDPQCASTLVGATDSMGVNLQTSCNLNALGIKVPEGTPGAITVGTTPAVIALVNAEPGKVGTLGMRTLTYYGQWNLDANVSKNFRISESKALQIRVDATNIFNHPIPNIPSFAVTTLGNVTGKGNQTRTFQGQLRLSF